MSRTSIVSVRIVALSLSIAALARTSSAQEHAEHHPRQRAARDSTARWAAVDSVLGRKGMMNPGGVMKFSFPRRDLQVTADGVQLKPALALGSWIAFADIGKGQAMMMGDLVLAESEIAPVMSALQKGGVEQSALHNHLVGETPRVMYMHVTAHGDPAKLAATVRDAFGQTATPMDTASAGGAPAAPFDLDTAAIAKTLGTHGKVNGGVYQMSVPRRETVRHDGHVVPPAMGVATALNFQPTSGGKVAATGDFVMTESEVNPVIRALRDNGITVTALHQHMLGETPRLYFMHFWANDDAAKVATGLRAGLDKMAVKK
ncbi:MAG: DUF1259 domain-containing protein [Gemmatimonadaceae bacterium]|nr:DUF1259 domain-containing protein [Gemmatimonadaceae bacterium]